jgi:DNA-directed RNA polymerase subunit RPC12/RpoP
MSSSLSFRCGGCHARIKAPIQLLGQSRPCPGCGHRLVVQMKAPPESGPLLVEDSDRYVYRHRSR